ATSPWPRPVAPWKRPSKRSKGSMPVGRNWKRASFPDVRPLRVAKGSHDASLLPDGNHRDPARPGRGVRGPGSAAPGDPALSDPSPLLPRLLVAVDGRQPDGARREAPRELSQHLRAAVAAGSVRAVGAGPGPGLRPAAVGPVAAAGGVL